MEHRESYLKTKSAFNRYPRLALWLALGILLVCAAVVLYQYNPIDSWWMPHCWWRQLTGTDCPSCGTLRAAHALLHGHFGEAMRHNPFLLIGLPLFGYIVWCEIKRRYRWQMLAIAAYVGLYFGWWILRNIL